MMVRLLVVVLVVFVGFQVFGQARTAASLRQHPYFRLLDAYTQRVLPGRREGRVVINKHFIIVWEGVRYPQVFAWKDTGGFFMCSMVRVHKLAPGRNVPPGMGYRPENIIAGKIARGDTLELTPAGAPEQLPAGVARKSVNTLFFKTNGSGWLASPVTKMTRKSDIAMP